MIEIFNKRHASLTQSLRSPWLFSLPRSLVLLPSTLFFLFSLSPSLHFLSLPLIHFHTSQSCALIIHVNAEWMRRYTKKRGCMYIWSSRGPLTSRRKQLRRPISPTVLLPLPDWAAVPDNIMEVASEKGKNTEEGFSAALCAPFIICMCEELQNCCYSFFPPSAFPPRNYEYGKKCQDVLGEGGAVDIREVADFFLEVHRVMIVFACVLCICQGQDRWSVCVFFLPTVV